MNDRIWVVKRQESGEEVFNLRLYRGYNPRHPSPNQPQKPGVRMQLFYFETNKTAFYEWQF